MPFGYLYGAIADARNALYENGFFKSFSLGAPVISIGNITVGGTGKTPLVAYVAEFLAENGEKICILTRGYGRENPGQRIIVSDGEKILADVKHAGDEPFELARKLSNKVVIIADKNRAEAGIWARENFGVSAFVLDDAFQHLRVRRDLNIVCIDATNPFGNGKVLPSGILREPLKNLKRADTVVITRAGLSENLENLKSEIAKYAQNSQIFVSRNKISNSIELKDFRKNQPTNTGKNLKNEKALAFCALGNPGNFFEQLRRNDFNITGSENFPDHHFYTQKDATKLEKAAKNIEADILLTTAKDAVKLENLEFAMPCYIIENKIIFDDEIDFRLLISDKIKQ